MDANACGDKPRERSALLFQGCPTCVMKALAVRGLELERAGRALAGISPDREDELHSCHDDMMEAFISVAKTACPKILPVDLQPHPDAEPNDDEDEDRAAWWEARRVAGLIGLGYLREAFQFISDHRETALEADAARMRRLEMRLATKIDRF